MFDQIEQRSPELMRLRDKLERLDAWLDDHADKNGTAKFMRRQDVWFSTERRYRQVYDAELREAKREAVAEAEQVVQGRMIE